jgi:hypothetical protein
MKINGEIRSFVTTDDIHEYLQSEYDRHIDRLDFESADQEDNMSYNDFIDHMITEIKDAMHYNNDWVLRVATEVRDGSANPIEEHLLNRMAEYGHELFCDDLLGELQG